MGVGCAQLLGVDRGELSTPDSPSENKAPALCRAIVLAALQQGEGMLRKVVSAAVILVLCVGVTLADEIRVFITKVDNGKVTFQENKGKGERGESKTLPVDAKVKVVKGKFDKDTKKTVSTGEDIEGGLKNKMFTDIGEKGVAATIITKDNKITEILVTKGKGKQQ
jgi:hypothetical protein